MMVANSFDLWQRDAFFSAAEEVQQSADIMESAYRLWMREKREGRAQEVLDMLIKELQAALGTAKWQLEEFERAVKLGHGHRHDDTTSIRHKQFVAAIEDQISRVEVSLAETFIQEGKQPLCWVNLNEEECDDLAMFLSGTSTNSQSLKDEHIKFRPSVKSSLPENPNGRNEAELTSKVSSCRDNSSEIRCHDNNSECIIDIEEKGSSGSVECRTRQTDRTIGARKTWSLPNFGTLRIVIPGEEGKEEEKNGVIAGIEATPKEKGTKSLFWLQRSREYNQSNGPVSLFNQLFCRVGDRQRQRQGLIDIPFSRSIQLILALMLMVFLLLPFVLYST